MHHREIPAQSTLILHLPVRSNLITWATYLLWCTSKYFQVHWATCLCGDFEVVGSAELFLACLAIIIWVHKPEISKMTRSEQDTSDSDINNWLIDQLLEIPPNIDESDFCAHWDAYLVLALHIRVAKWMNILHRENILKPTFNPQGKNT